MKLKLKQILPLLIIGFAINSRSWAQTSQKDIARWHKTAAAVTIIRDNWGIPHIYGKSDADAVFGLMYAQCEDDFNRIELNYLEKLGRLAEIDGENSLYNDLYIRLVIDEKDAKSDYEKSPAWLKKLLNAFADGMNYYLYKNPSVKPKILTRFEPWYPLLWTDGSIGAISTGYLSAQDVKNFYSSDLKIGKVQKREDFLFEYMDGSNGFAISGSNSATGNAMLYINPHVTLYFRPEVHMVSEEGLNAYGAVTWGQFFIYQGFNQYNGWMHTSSDVDVSDVYLEKVSKKDDNFFYEYEGAVKPMTKKQHTLQYKGPDGLKSKLVTTYATHHGPILSKQRDQWVSVKSNNRSMTGLIQSWERTKTKGLEDYKKIMDLKANTSNNTVYADNKGNIAYWHGNYVPIRDASYNWRGPVDGTTAKTEWKGLHAVDETVHLYNPSTGWIQNCNSTPFTAAGESSPKRTDYPTYMAPDGENYRGVNASRVLSGLKKLTMDDLIAAGYDRYLAAFEKLVPALVNAYDRQRRTDTAYAKLEGAIGQLKTWDLRSSEESVATTLAIEWGQKLIPKMRQNNNEDEYEYIDQLETTIRYLKRVNDKELLDALAEVVQTLTNNFGTWEVGWGQMNRFQRIAVNEVYTDDKPSMPVGFASSAWGSLPSYASRLYPGTKKRYCYGGNSFICAVEFGERIKAKSLLAGGESGNRSSEHFNDQGEMYTKGKFKDVLFYKEDVLKNAESTYHPGEQ